MQLRPFDAEKMAMEQRLGAGAPAAYAPFAEAWKEFDKLEARAKHGLPKSLKWAEGILVVVCAGIAGRFRHTPHWYDAGWLAVLTPALFAVPLRMLAKRRLAEWKCPRCGALWPGTATEKESKCNVCGLRLHQMA